jgi:glycosyltransferase involved in cell wall biosynthesis
MNVLVVVPWDDKRGGVMSVLDNLAQYLQAEGHSVLFFHHSDGPLVLKRRTTKLGFKGVQLRLSMPFGPGVRGVLRTLVFPFLFASSLVQLIWLLRSRHIDIVNLHYPIDNFVYFAICRRLHLVRVVTSVHGSDVFYKGKPKGTYSHAFRSVIDSSDLVILPSEAYRRKMVDAFPSVRERTVFIHNGIDRAQFRMGQRERKAHESGNPYMLCVADLQEYKAIDVLLYAARPLLVSKSSLTLVLAGDGPLRSQLEELASSLGIRHQVMFLGNQGATEIARLLAGCELMVLPSRMESFGIAVIEAMACRAPVVASAVGGITEIVEHETSGILVEPENPEALTAGLQRVLTDGNLRRTIAANGYSRVKERFCSTHTGAAYLRAFNSVLSAGKARPYSPSPIPADSPDGDARAAS